MTQLYLAVLGTGYCVQAFGTLRAEERAGRLEPRLAGTLSRRRWLTAHAAVVLSGLVLLTTAGSALLAATSSWSLGDASGAGRVLRSGFAYLPSELVLAAIALAVVAAWPRAYSAAWAVFAGTTFVALLGPGLRLPGWVRDLAPTTHAGYPPLRDAGPAAPVVLAGVAVALVLVAFAAFRRRAVPA